MTDPLEIRYAKIQERLEPCVTELNTKNKTVKIALENNLDIIVAKLKKNIAEKNNYSILFILDESQLEDKLWPILKENKSINYLEKKIINVFNFN